MPSQIEEGSASNPELYVDPLAAAKPSFFSNLGGVFTKALETGIDLLAFREKNKIVGTTDKNGQDPTILASEQATNQGQTLPPGQIIAGIDNKTLFVGAGVLAGAIILAAVLTRKG